MKPGDAELQALDEIFKARSVAVVGASTDTSKFGGMTLKTLIGAGYDGKIYPINPRADSVQGLKAYPSIADVPGEIELAVIIVPAPFVKGVLQEAAAKGARGAVILSTGFRESGYPEREAEITSVAQELGLRFLGPNIQGINYVPNRLCAMIMPVITMLGPLAVISQSGSVTAALSEWAENEGLGISTAVNLGNQADLCESDVLAYLGQDEHTKAIAMYLEGVKDGRRFLETASRIVQAKPVVVLKSGRSATGRRSAASHTASLAGRDEVFDAACRQFGLVRVDDLETLYDKAKALATMRPPRGNRLLVVSTSGGGNTLAADEAEAHGLVMPSLPPAYVEQLQTIGLPPNAGIANPLDLAGITAEHFVQAVLMADELDVADTYLISFGDPVVGSTEAVKRIADNITASLALAYFGGGELGRESSIEIQAAGIPVFATPERAIRGIAAAVWHSEQRRSKGLASLGPPYQSFEASERNDCVLLEPEAIQILDEYNIRYPVHGMAGDAEDAVQIAERLGYPVVIKVVSPDVVHKSDADGSIIQP